jgi:hypothetical protein
VGGRKLVDRAEGQARCVDSRSIRATPIPVCPSEAGRRRDAHVELVCRVDLWNGARVDLRRRLDRLVETFTEELLGLISHASLEDLVGKSRAREIRRQAEREAARTAAAARPVASRAKKPAKAPARVAAPSKPARGAPLTPKKARVGAEKPRSIAPGPTRRAPSARPPAAAPATPDRRTIERALLGALRHGLPMGEADLFDAAALASEVHGLAREALEGLVERGIFGKSALAGSTLFFAKPPQRRSTRPRREAAPTPAPQPQPAPEPWRPVVIRRRKNVPGAPVETITPTPVATREGEANPSEP